MFCILLLTIETILFWFLDTFVHIKDKLISELHVFAHTYRRTHPLRQYINIE